MAIAYEKSKMPDKAVKLIQNFGFASTDFVPLLYLLGKCFYLLEDYQQAATYLAKVVEKDKKNFNAQTMLIDSFLRERLYQAAQAALQYALASAHPRSAEFRKILQEVESRTV
jgi:tetratricopeptide (TPR) repeat protein